MSLRLGSAYLTCAVVALVSACVSDEPEAASDSGVLVDAAPGSDSGDARDDAARPNDAAANDAADGDTASDADVDAGEPELARASRVDLLFVIDDSNSMLEEQAALAAQIPRLLETLSTGMRDGERFAAPAGDVHIGVVSTDMGLVGVEGIPGCQGFGHDGVLLHAPPGHIAGCASSYPQFLSFDASSDPTQATTDVGCLLSLGNSGCGFEQHFEAMLKALTPRRSSIKFMTDSSGRGGSGHGDGANRGFLRNDAEDPSLLAVILLSDEEDCSSRDTRLFTPQSLLDPNDPLYSQDLNLRCFHNKTAQHPISRYVDGLRALRPGNEHLVVFGAIVGVPAELVSRKALAHVDFENSAERNAHYDALLEDPRMIEALDPTRPTGAGNLLPSCARLDPQSYFATTRAYPPRRSVALAKALGENASVQSICQGDLKPAVDGILDMIAPRLVGGVVPEVAVDDPGADAGQDGGTSQCADETLHNQPAPGCCVANTNTCGLDLTKLGVASCVPRADIPSPFFAPQHCDGSPVDAGTQGGADDAGTQGGTEDAGGE